MKKSGEAIQASPFLSNYLKYLKLRLLIQIDLYGPCLNESNLLCFSVTFYSLFSGHSMITLLFHYVKVKNKM